MFMAAGFYLSQKNKGNEEENEKDKDLTPSDIISIFYISETNLDSLFSVFKNLLKSTCLFDGEIKATKHLLDSLELSDLENIIGEYFLNFVMPSI